MEVTEEPSRIGPSWLNVTGSGSLTAADGTRVTLKQDGWNVKLSANSALQHSLLINFFPDGGGVGYGQFTGDLSGADMVGILERDERAHPPSFFPPTALVRFTRP